MASSDYFLLFTQHFDRDKGLDYGRLSLNSLSEGTKVIWVATSSVSSKQYSESFHVRGGLIPPQYRCPKLPKYDVLTNPIPLPHVKGVEGNFYKIEPHFVVTDRGTTRSDFGIHLDANVPGSLGCIVLSESRFYDFESRIGELDVDSVPLFVQYS